MTVKGKVDWVASTSEVGLTDSFPVTVRRAQAVNDKRRVAPTKKWSHKA